jgi:DNA mismatch endonuclease, patch repair protein
MDRLNKQRRSWNMSRIRSENTEPERLVRQFVHRLGFRFRLGSGKKIFGNPDIVLPKYKTVIFVNGCFWHRHAGCKFCYTPKTRQEFWMPKFARNKARDAKVHRRLRRHGWRVIVVWECQTANLRQLARRLAEFR